MTFLTSDVMIRVLVGSERVSVAYNKPTFFNQYFPWRIVQLKFHLYNYNHILYNHQYTSLKTKHPFSDWTRRVGCRCLKCNSDGLDINKSVVFKIALRSLSYWVHLIKRRQHHRKFNGANVTIKVCEHIILHLLFVVAVLESYLFVCGGDDKLKQKKFGCPRSPMVTYFLVVSFHYWASMGDKAQWRHDTYDVCGADQTSGPCPLISCNRSWFLRDSVPLLFRLAIMRVPKIMTKISVGYRPTCKTCIKVYTIILYWCTFRTL